MISDKAVAAATAAFCANHDMRAALQAALPVLLEGKAEEIARVIDPEIYSPLAMVSNDWKASRHEEALAKANRIISILTDGAP